VVLALPHFPPHLTWRSSPERRSPGAEPVATGGCSEGFLEGASAVSCRAPPSPSTSGDHGLRDSGDEPLLDTTEASGDPPVEQLLV